MALQRVSTLSLHQTTLSDVTSMQAKLANLQNQVSSGMKSDNFQGLNGQVETFVQLEGKMRKTQTLMDNNTVIISRLQTMDVAMQQIIEIADDFQDLTVQARNPVSKDDLQFEITARAQLEMLAGQLNTQMEGRYLFSGSKTDTMPVPSPIQGPVVAGVPDDGYYAGNNDTLYARVQEQFSIAYNIRANEGGFQKLFSAIHLGLNAHSNGSDGLMAQASELATEALDEILAIRAREQQNKVNIEEINERHTQLNLYWKGVTEDISKTDVLSASTEIALNEAILQASFQSFTRLNELRLSDFLR